MKIEHHSPVTLITGSAKRLGAIIAKYFHGKGHRVAIHYRHSQEEAETLAKQLNTIRQDSAITLQFDLNNIEQLDHLLSPIIHQWGRLDMLINNASDFFPTPFGRSTHKDWQTLINSNLTAPYFLTQAAAPFLKKTHGSVINISDKNGSHPRKDHPIYSTAKGGLNTLTVALAQELSPSVRVNAVELGKTIPPEGQNVQSTEKYKQTIESTLLKKMVETEDVCALIEFLFNQRSTTGKIFPLNSG